MDSDFLNAPSLAGGLDLDGLRAFAAIADRGSVGAAADAVGRTAAAVSMQLKKLEERVGARLFDRPSTAKGGAGRGMRLTPNGERLLARARRILALEREALGLFSAADMVGDVRIGLIDEFGETPLADVLAAFARSHPDVAVSVTVGVSARLAEKAAAGDVDFCLLTPGGDVAWSDGDILARDEPLVWVGRAEGDAVAREPLPVALASAGCAWRRVALDALASADRPHRVAYNSDTYAGQRAAVSADLAIAPLPLSVSEPGFAVLGPAQGLPELPRARLALRWAPGTRTPAAAALAEDLLCALRC